MFEALADPTRRRIVERLTREPASVSKLARPMEMTLAGVAQHLRVLEESGLISTSKVGRVRTCRVEPNALRAVETWIAEQMLWERRLGRLDKLLAREAQNGETT
jgi:DNA-binding transcriptional ArsR family regulator